MNTIAITAFRRPELVKIQFNQLLKDPEELKKYRVHLFLDYGFDPDIYKVISWFKQYHREIKLTLRSQIDAKRSPMPAFFNIMESYYTAAEESDEFVIIMEEDIIVTNDYLKFNRLCYEQFLSKYDRIFCICHKRRPDTELVGDPEILIGDYQLTSPSCMSVQTIKNTIYHHINNPLFFTNPIHYNSIFFPKSKNKPNIHIHHDGQIERIAEKNNMYSLKPDQARSMHVGVGGQHDRGASLKITGTLNEKVAKYYELISLGSQELRKYVASFKDDIVVVPLDITPYNKLYLDIDRTMAKASSWWYDITNEFKGYISENSKN
jgi:hypothetical protein